MTRRNGTSSPRPARVAPPTASLEPLVARLGERESLLRSLLLDARDELVRSRLGSPGDSGSTGRPIAAGLAVSPAIAREEGDYAAFRRRLTSALETILPGGARSLVVSRGDDRLLDIGDSGTAEHFPATSDGRYAGHHPGDSAEAIAELEARREAGAEFLVIPAFALWWLDHYGELAAHLARRYRRVLDAPEAAVAFDLREVLELAEPRARPQTAGARRQLAATTIISRNYLAQARVLARSFLEHEPDGRFYLLVVDHLPDGVEVGAEVTLVDPRELVIPSFYEMCFKYGVVELATAVKPYLLSLLFAKYDEESVVYLDPDILIQRPMDELRSTLEEHEAVLTPHIMSPLPDDGKHPTEQDIMISGAYNLGFIALKRSDEARSLLAWWEERLADGCRIDVPNGLFTDQKWIDLVPSLFPFAAILRDPTYNVAFWNLHEREIGREIDRADGRFLVNGRPGTFFHVSGFDPRQPEKLSKHQSRIEVEPGSALAGLLEHYATRLFEEGFEEASAWEYGYDRFASGARVHPILRQLFLKLSPDERARFGDPFADGPGSFLAWATGPGETPEALSRFLETIYQIRYDLPLAFPDVRGRDRTAFLDWARRWGSSEMGFEPELVRDVALEAPPGRPAAAAAAAAAGAGRRRIAATSAAPPRASEELRQVTGQLPLAGYRDLVDRVRDVARATVPPGARVLVINKGDYRLLDLGGAEGWHFPQTESGIYGGFYPGDSAVAIAHLESLRERGATHLLIPATALWWLDHYAEFAGHLEARYRILVDDAESCRIYALAEPDGAATISTAAGPEVTEPAERPFWRDKSGSETGNGHRRKKSAASKERPIVIYGAARSGTTYLVKILNKHPRVYITDESRVFLWAHEMMQRVRWHERAEAGAVDEEGGRRVGDRAQLSEFLVRSLPGTLRDYYRELEPRADFWGDKNPHYADPRDVGCLETIIELYPGARFLHIVRDGRDVVTSGMRGNWTDFERVHSMWASHLDLGRSFGRTLPADQYLEFHYEELVADDAGMANRLLDFLGIERDPAVERFCRNQQKRRTGFCTPTRDLEGGALASDWSSFFSARERLRSLELLGPNLIRFGYETEGSLAAARQELLPLAVGEGPPI